MHTVIFVYFEGSRAHASQVKQFYKCTSKPEKIYAQFIQFSSWILSFLISKFFLCVQLSKTTPNIFHSVTKP